jgi:hypothetical protein
MVPHRAVEFRVDGEAPTTSITSSQRDVLQARPHSPYQTQNHVKSLISWYIFVASGTNSIIVLDPPADALHRIPSEEK